MTELNPPTQPDAPPQDATAAAPHASAEGTRPRNPFATWFGRALALILVALAENARMPVDDPTTHLELTMIHEVMILDHSGPDLAMIEYGSALKLWVMGALAVGVAVPVQVGAAWLDAVCFLAGMFAFAVAIGVAESAMARLRLVRVPQFLVAAAVSAALSLIIVARNY
jgi:formate hydrogenlyase subunit 4